MPLDETVYEQVERMHTIQINRGRGIISDVESRDEAASWFEGIATRT